MRQEGRRGGRGGEAEAARSAEESAAPTQNTIASTNVAKGYSHLLRLNHE
jgi:hypothetical protein